MINSSQMESPVRIDLPRLSHLHLLELLLPLVPGIVVATGLTLTSSPIACRFWHIPLGYKARLALALALAYALGLAMTTITQAADSFVMRLLKKYPPAQPWANTYWRRVAASFVGSGLVPKIPSSLSPKELDDLVKYVSGLRENSVATSDFVSRYKSIQKLEESLKKYGDTTARIPPGKTELAKEITDKGASDASRASSALEEAKRSLAESEETIRIVASDIEWLSLFNALETLPKPKSPYLPLKFLMTSLQTAAIAAIYLVVEFKELWSPVAAVLWALVLFATTHTLWLDFQFNQYLRNLNSSQIAAMLQAIRDRPQQEECEPK